MCTRQMTHPHLTLRSRAKHGVSKGEVDVWPAV
jgi:hypothetical protein